MKSFKQLCFETNLHGLETKVRTMKNSIVSWGKNKLGRNKQNFLKPLPNSIVQEATKSTGVGRGKNQGLSKLQRLLQKNQETSSEEPLVVLRRFRRRKGIINNPTGKKTK